MKPRSTADWPQSGRGVRLLRMLLRVAYSPKKQTEAPKSLKTQTESSTCKLQKEEQKDCETFRNIVEPRSVCIPGSQAQHQGVFLVVACRVKGNFLKLRCQSSENLPRRNFRDLVCLYST